MFARHRPVLWWGVAVGALALLVRLALLGGATAWVDSPLYEHIAGSILRGDGFSSGGHVFGDAYRMPGYPVIVAIARLFPGETAPALGTLQHLAGVAFAVAVLLVATRFFGLVTGVISGVLIALAPLQLYVEHAVLPDFAFAVLVAAGVALVAEAAAREDPQRALLLLAGAVLAAATYVKPNGLVLLALAPLTFLLARRGWRPALRAGLICGAVLGLALAPWVVRNWVRDGTPALTTQAGAALWVTAFDYDELAPRPHTADERAAVLAGNHAAAMKRHLGFPRLTYAQVFAALRHRGLSPAQASSTMSAMAERAIREHPGDYLSGAANVLDTHWHMAGEARWARHLLRGPLDRPPGLGTVAVARGSADAADTVFSVWWMLTLGGLSGIALLWARDRRPRAGGAALLSGWALIAVGVALTNTIDLRYVAQVAPLVWTAGVAGTVFLVRSIVAAMRRKH